jgi:ERF superfamily
VHRSSETFAALASALAKAQAHLVNPEKSLTATITTGRAGETERSFRYAPLSSGLEIVRKTLSEQEIAVIQTTAVDQASRMLNLTTLLAHSSGEWIASHWPVCSIAEIASPHRMGAALTYARRYALFTLVGIAGEDDLDAPDLCDGPRSPAPPADERSLKPGPGQPPVQQRKPDNGQRRHGMHGERQSILEPEQTAALREKLLTAVGSITSADSAAIWAREALAAKNRLAAADAKLVEDAFERRLSELAPTGTVGAADDVAPTTRVERVGVHEMRAKGNDDLDQPNGIDKSTLVIATPRRYRNREHLRYVARQACLICGRKQSDPHHLRYLQPRALGRKASDEFAVPLCRSHHRAVHRAGDEQAWWTAAGIDPVKVARQLWRQTRLNDPQDPHQAGLAPRPETQSIASGADGTKESRTDQLAISGADDGRVP